MEHFVLLARLRYSTILQRLLRQISLDYHTIPPATQAKLEETSSGLASFRSSGPRAATACRNGKKEERLGLGAVYRDLKEK